MKHINKDDDGFLYWMSELDKGQKRESIEQYFRQTAAKELREKSKIGFSDLLDKNDKGRVLFVVKESAGDIFLCTALFESIKKRYPEKALYVATKPEYKSVLDGNPHVNKWLEYNPIMENLLWAEGRAGDKGYFDICYLPTIGTQSIFNYQHNGVDTIDLDLLAIK